MTLKMLALFLTVVSLNSVAFADPAVDPAIKAKQYTGAWRGACWHEENGQSSSETILTFNASKYPEVSFSEFEFNQSFTANKPRSISEDGITMIWTLVVPRDGAEMNLILTDVLPDLSGGMWYRESRWDFTISEDFSSLKLVKKFSEYSNGTAKEGIEGECRLKRIQN